MENASKALLIAGAILLAILIISLGLISLGLMAYQQAKNTVGSSNLSKTEIESFNSQWENYLGTNKTASEVRSLYSAVIAHNASEENLGTGRKIKIGTDEPTSIPSIDYSKTYKVEASYEKGLITTITYTANS